MSDNKRVECSGCKHWQANKSTDRHGECRRYAPMIHVQSKSTPSRQWPTTKPDDWCGEGVEEQR